MLMNLTKASLATIAAVASMTFSTIAFSAPQSFSSQAALESELETFYTNSFTGLGTNGSRAAMPFSSGGFSYTISSKDPNRLFPLPLTDLQLYYHEGRVASRATVNDLVITMTTPTDSFGANFYFINNQFTTQFTPINVTFTLSDNSTWNYTGPSGFVGYSLMNDGRTITKVVLARANLVFGIVDNLVVGNAIPEASSFGVIAGAAVLGLVVSRRRRV